MREPAAIFLREVLRTRAISAQILRPAHVRKKILRDYPCADFSPRLNSIHALARCRMQENIEIHIVTYFTVLRVLSTRVRISLRKFRQKKRHLNFQHFHQNWSTNLFPNFSKHKKRSKWEERTILHGTRQELKRILLWNKWQM